MPTETPSSRLTMDGHPLAHSNRTGPCTCGAGHLIDARYCDCRIRGANPGYDAKYPSKRL